MKTRRDFLKRTVFSGISAIIAARTAPVYAKYMGRNKSNVSLEEAQEVHDRMLIIDGHNDTPVKRVARGENPLKWKQRDVENYTRTYLV